MVEQRKNPRYSVSSAVRVAVETDVQRYSGTLHNVSVCGMSIRAERHLSVGSVRPAKGDPVQGEIMFQNGLRKLSGSLVRVDSGCVSMQFSAKLSENELSCLTGGRAGAVRWKDGEAHVEGVLSFELRRDMLSSASKKMPINLSQVSRIDSAGIGLVLLAQERGSAVGRCSQKIHSIMQVARVCMACQDSLCESIGA